MGLWCDELPPNSVSGDIGEETTVPEIRSPAVIHEGDDDTQEDVLDLQQWQENMLSSTAAEVRAAIGGIVLILPVKKSYPSAESRLDYFMPYLRAAHSLREAVEDESLGRDVASIVILRHSQSSSSTNSGSEADNTLKSIAESLETRAIDNDMFGWDVACCNDQPHRPKPGDENSQKRNEFGEKLGMARVIEVIEGIDWAASAAVDGEDEGPENQYGILDDHRFKGLDHELQQEMLGLKLSMLDGGAHAANGSEGEDVSPQQMDDLKSRVLAIRDSVAGMPQSQKEAFAKREIDKIMRDL